MMKVTIAPIGGGSITFNTDSAAAVQEFLDALRKTPDSGTVTVPDGNNGSITLVRVQAIACVTASA